MSETDYDEALEAYLEHVIDDVLENSKKEEAGA